MKTKYIIGMILAAIGFIMIIKTQQKDSSGAAGAVLTPVNNVTHGHGLAVDVSDSNKLYIATHHGLFVLMNDKDLFKIGGSNDDFMGFSIHPNDPKIFFSSGHPVFGGNIGFQKSNDGGLTWKKVSNGINGPVDFHAMTVSPANANLIYGWYKGVIQRSINGGENWEALPVPFVATSLVANPTEENVVYAVNPQDQGILVSKDKGKTWESLSPEFQGTAVNALAIQPGTRERMLSYSEKLGLAESNDGGLRWQSIDAAFDGEPVFIAFAKQQPNMVYLLTHENIVYKSTDTGKTWQKIR